MGKLPRRSCAALVIALVIVALAAVPGVAAPSAADLEVTVTGSPDIVAPPGGVVTYSVQLRNNGPSAAPATLSDSSTGGGTFFSNGSTIPAGCTAPVNGTPNPVIDCTFNLMTSGQIITLVVAITTVSDPGAQSNEATATIPPNVLNVLDGNEFNNVDSVTTPVKLLADVGVTVDGPDEPALTDSTIAYIVTATNNGPSTATITLSDVSTGGGTFDAGASTIPAGCSAPDDGTVDPTITCSFTLDAATSQATIVGIHTPSSPGSVSNAASVAVPADTIDNNDANDSASDSTSVEIRADLAVTVDGPETTLAGDPVAYVVTVTNNGPSSSDAALTDVSLGGGSFDAAGSTIPSECSAPADGTLDPTITCSFTAIAAGGTRQLTVALTAAYASGTQSNAASVAAPSEVIDDTPGNNSDSASTLIQTLADLAVTVTGTPSTVSPAGSGLLHFVTVKNNGPSTTDISVEVASTGGGALVLGSSIFPSGCTAPANGSIDPTFTCTFTGAESGARFLIRIALQTSTTPGSETTTATVSVPENVTDGNADNDSDSLVTPVVNDLTGSFAWVQSGGSLSFQLSTLTASNAPNGVIAFLGVAQANGGVCGSVPCDNGLRVDFDPDPEFQGTVTLLIDFGRGNPCRGIGGGADCSKLFMRKLGVIIEVPTCASQPDADVCILQIRKRADAPNIQWIVRLLSTDPEFLPPLNRSVG